MSVPGLRLMRWSEDGGAPVDLPELPSEVERARALIARRRLRTEVFGTFADLFYDPVWDVLLRLFVAHEEGVALTIGALCLEPPMPPMVRRRWLLAMEQRHLVTCWAIDPTVGAGADDRHVGLTPQAVTMLLNYLDEI